MATAEIISSDPNVAGTVTTADGFEVSSNYETPEQLRKSLGDGEPSAASPDVAEPEPVNEPRSRRRRNRDPELAVKTAVAHQREAERIAEERTARLATIEAENEDLKKKLAAPPAMAAPAAAVAPAPVAPAVSSAPSETQEQAWQRYAAMPDAPNIEQFKTIQDYQFAVSHFITGKMVTENMQQMARRNMEQQVHAQFTQRIADAKTRIPDYDQRFNPSTPVDARVFPYIQRLENAPDVMLYLSEHQDIAQRLTTLHPVDQIGQIGEIAGTLKTQGAAASSAASARPAISTAKPPTKRVVGAPPAATDEPPGDDASEEAHEAYWGPRRAQMRQHRRHR